MMTVDAPQHATKDRVSLSALLSQGRELLEAWRAKPQDGQAWDGLSAKRREIADEIARLPNGQKSGADVEDVRAFLRTLAASGVWDYPVGADAIGQADELKARGWPGLLAAMTLTPAWQWASAPALESAPAWLWGDYVEYLFYAPQGFTAVKQADEYAAQYLRRLGELARLATANRGSSSVRAALDAYGRMGSCIPLYFARESLRRHYELRGRILAAAAGVGRQDGLEPMPRQGRRLRVGFVNRHFGPQTETYTTLPTFEQLDPERFEVLLFVHHRTGTPVESYAAERVAELRDLQGDTVSQVEQLRAANLDVVVFGTNVTAICNEVTLLALHRVAPLQVINNSSCTTSGLPEIDMYVSGEMTESVAAPEHFSERLGLLSGPAHAFNYDADRAEPTTTWTREALGLPADAVVFVSAANYFKIIPEMREAWARLLAAVPGSHLLLHPFNPNWSLDYPILRFRTEMERALAAHGIEASRLVISTNRFPSRSDVKALLAVGDIYLDTFPFGGVNSLVDPLELGMPVVAWEGETFRSRMGGALLRAIELPEMIATNGESYHAIAAGLASDAGRRATCVERIKEKMERLPVFLDTLAASDAFGTLLERAYDELETLGHKAFRAKTSPIIAPDVAAPAWRTSRGRDLLANGDAARASDYFLAAIQHDGKNSMLWRELATALRDADRGADAVSCLEAALRLNPRDVKSWRLLVDMARALGHAELETEAIAVLDQLTAEGAAPSRILLYTDDPAAGGVAQYNHSIMLGMLEAGYDVACAQSRSESPLVTAQRGVGITHHWIPYDTTKDFSRTLDDQSSALQIIEEAKPDLIIFSDCCPLSNLAARDAALKLGVPYVVVVGFVGAYLADRFKQQMPKLAVQYAAARDVVAVSQENLELLRRHFGLSAAAGQVIHYGRPERFFTPRNEAVRSRLRAELKLPDDALVCFTAARLAQVKGHLYQIAAAKRLLAEPGGSKFHFVWAGDGEQRAEIERAVAEAGIARHVHLLGHRWDMSDWYDAADIFVLPSDMEGMPLAIMEAMAKGLPVAATAVSGIPEQLGDTGQLLPSGTKNRAALVDHLVRTLQQWAGDAALRARIGEAGRVRAQAMFREPMMVERTITLVSRHVGEPATVLSA